VRDFLRRGAALALLFGTILGGAVSPARAAEVGLSDQQATAWSDTRLRGLGLKYARLIVPWNAATVPSEIARTQAWLDAVAAAGMEPHIAFEHLRTDDCPDGSCTLPTRAQYRSAVAAFIARWPQVRTFTTWNEANHSSQPVADRPEMVAAYWAELSAACPGCTIVAGDVLDSGGYVRWLQRFLAAAAPAVPQLWGLHNYGDVTYGRTTGTDDVLAAVPGQLWVEETGGIVTLRDERGRTTLSSNETRAATAVDRAFAIAAARPRIARMYVYQWRAGASDRFDSGLLRPDGTARPSYTALVADLRTLAGQAAATAGVVAAAAPAVSVKASWSKAKPSQLVLRVTCAAAATRCRGRLVPTIRTRAKAGAKLRTMRLAARTYATTSKKRTVTVRVTVGKKARARVRAAATRQLVVKFTASLPVKGVVVTQTLGLKRR
jgi:hypothetical protein